MFGGENFPCRGEKGRGFFEKTRNSRGIEKKRLKISKKMRKYTLSNLLLWGRFLSEKSGKGLVSSSPLPWSCQNTAGKERGEDEGSAVY
ncbi:MAG: hypothetical protein MR286_01435, partial [Clostridiales bacterium]|nr:hypothetical protein [Clostridiales bacterium]